MNDTDLGIIAQYPVIGNHPSVHYNKYFTQAYAQLPEQPFHGDRLRIYLGGVSGRKGDLHLLSLSKKILQIRY